MYNQNRQFNLSQIGTSSPPKSVHAGHPFKSPKAAKRLADFVFSRMDFAARVRDARIKRLTSVDKHLYGWLRLSETDRQRKAKYDATGQPYAIQQHLPLNMLHLIDRMAYFSGIFAPTNGMFQHVGSVKQQIEGQNLLRIMNQQSQRAGYYPHMMRAILDLLKYQVGGLITEWDMEAGYEVVRQGAESNLAPTIVWEGNVVQAVDMYNAFWQPGIEPEKVDSDSEYFATARRVTYHEIQKKGMVGEWVNVDEALSLVSRRARSTMTSGTSYYKYPPSEAKLVNDAASQGQWDYLATDPSLLNGASATDGVLELVTVWVWLNPYEHNLVLKNAANKANRNRLELWKLQYLQGSWLVYAEHQNNAHSKLPVSLATHNYDALGEQQKSTTEITQSLQDFLSFLLNTHIQGTRGNVFGLTIYDAEIVDLNQLPEGEVSGRVPARPAGGDRDLSKAIHRVNNTVDTKQTMQDFQNLLGVLQQLMPSQALPSQIAGIDRAVDRQVAAVVQGGNRPLQASARLIDETLLRNWRTKLYYNTLQYQPDVETYDENGEIVTIQAEQLTRVGLQYVIGQGLKALDKQLVAQELQRLIQTLLQSQQAIQEVDILALIEAWSNYMDIDIDMTQFRRQQPAQQALPTTNPTEPPNASAGV